MATITANTKEANTIVVLGDEWEKVYAFGVARGMKEAPYHEVVAAYKLSCTRWN